MVASRAPAAEQLNALFCGLSRIRCRRRWRTLEIIRPAFLARCQTSGAAAANLRWCSRSAPFPGEALISFALTINQPPPCLTGYLPAQWRAMSDTSVKPVENGLYCKIPRRRRRTWCAVLS